MIISDNSIIYNSTSEMQQICAPLFQNTSITYFEYVRIYKDGHALKLDTSENVLPYILSNDLYLKPCDISEFSTHMFMSTNISDLNNNISVEVLREYKNGFNLDNFFFLVEKHDVYIEVFVFGAEADNFSIINYYLRNIDSLNNFSIYFLDKAKDLIDQAVKERFTFIEWQTYFKNNRIEIFQKKDNLLFIPKTVYFKLDGEAKERVLSYREFQCVIEYLKGNSAKKAANNLHISPRTIEKHITNIKKKLDCANKDQILKIIKNNGYQKFIDYE